MGVAMDRPFFIPEPRVIAHRGASGSFPENTELSFRRAIESGADVIETDIHFTKDRNFVIAHDGELERVSDGSGPIAERTVEEIKKLDAAYRFTPDGGTSYPFRGTGIAFMTLEEMLTGFPGTKFNIDLKTKNAAQVKHYAAIIARCGASERVLTASEYTPNLRAVRKAIPGMATSFSLREALWYYFLFRAGLLFMKKVFPGDALQIPEFLGPSNIASDAFIDTAHRKGLRVHVWTVNEAKSMRRLLKAGVDAIVSDKPEVLAGIVTEVLG
jgi:glycerophosphoryl diester phosphodiesterase